MNKRKLSIDKYQIWNEGRYMSRSSTPIFLQMNAGLSHEGLSRDWYNKCRKPVIINTQSTNQHVCWKPNFSVFLFSITYLYRNDNEYLSTSFLPDQNVLPKLEWWSLSDIKRKKGEEFFEQNSYYLTWEIPQQGAASYNFVIARNNRL